MAVVTIADANSEEPWRARAHLALVVLGGLYLALMWLEGAGSTIPLSSSRGRRSISPRSRALPARGRQRHRLPRGSLALQRADVARD